MPTDPKNRRIYHFDRQIDTNYCLKYRFFDRLLFGNSPIYRLNSPTSSRYKTIDLFARPTCPNNSFI